MIELDAHSGGPGFERDMRLQAGAERSESYLAGVALGVIDLFGHAVVGRVGRRRQHLRHQQQLADGLEVAQLVVIAVGEPCGAIAETALTL